MTLSTQSGILAPNQKDSLRITIADSGNSSEKLITTTTLNQELDDFKNEGLINKYTYYLSLKLMVASAKINLARGNTAAAINALNAARVRIVNQKTPYLDPRAKEILTNDIDRFLASLSL